MHFRSPNTIYQTMSRFHANRLARMGELSSAAQLDADAGDIWPTFVTPDDARHYIDETDAAYARLDSAILASNVADDFKLSWGIQLATWKAFALSAKPAVGWLNTSAVMQQTDRFNEQLKNWFTGFQAVGGKPVGPPPITPGQGVPDPHPTTLGDVTTLALVLGGLAGLVIFGPKIAKFL